MQMYSSCDRKLRWLSVQPLSKMMMGRRKRFRKVALAQTYLVPVITPASSKPRTKDPKIAEKKTVQALAGMAVTYGVMFSQDVARSTKSSRAMPGMTTCFATPCTVFRASLPSRWSSARVGGRAASRTPWKRLRWRWKRSEFDSPSCGSSVGASVRETSGNERRDFSSSVEFGSGAAATSRGRAASKGRATEVDAAVPNSARKHTAPFRRIVLPERIAALPLH
mmetsp:Transcript_23378/g.73645  ORF Transcript_23378/g.73645 Transcript_23378/m.73645 type:complete len:223 (+) Transcript_23378:1422-2090(+)